jgi:hypothetical protein
MPTAIIAMRIATPLIVPPTMAPVLSTPPDESATGASVAGTVVEDADRETEVEVLVEVVEDREDEDDVIEVLEEVDDRLEV